MLRVAVAASLAVASAILPASLPPHPRLVLTPTRISDLQALIASGDADLLAGMSYLTNFTDLLLTLPALHCQDFEPSRSSLAYPMLTRILSLGLVYKLTANVSIGRRAVAELLNLTTDHSWGAGSDPHQGG